MPFSILIPIGLLIALIGAGLYWRTRSRRQACSPAPDCSWPRAPSA